jgi:hypothetical protein
MKKVIVNFGLMLLAMLFLPGCSSNEEEEELPGTVIPQVTCSSETVAFFETEWPVYSMPYPETFFEEDLRGKENISLINSEEEFQSIYKGMLQLPEIDFSQYTLVIGQKRIETYIGKKSSAEFHKLELRDTPEGYHLYLCCNSYIADGAIIYDETFYYYWALYPKLDNKTITVSLKY